MFSKGANPTEESEFPLSVRGCTDCFYTHLCSAPFFTDYKLTARDTHRNSLFKDALITKIDIVFIAFLGGKVFPS